MTNNEFYIKQKKEAIRRMEGLVKKYDLNPNLIKYLKNDRPYYSYLICGLVGCIDTITYDDVIYKAAIDFEKKYDAYVYHAIESYTNYGRLISYLFVSKYEEEWNCECPLDKSYDNYLSAYVYNVDDDYGEIGSIKVSSDGGAIIRIG